MAVSRLLPVSLIAICAAVTLTAAHAYPYLPGASNASARPTATLARPQHVVETVTDPVFAQAMRLYQQGNDAAALVKLQSVLARSPKNPEALGFAGFLELRIQNLAQAEIYLADALKYDPHNITDRSNLGSVYALEGKYALAVPNLKIAAAANPKDLYTQARLAGALAQLGRSGEALAVYAKCAANPACPPEILKNYGLTLARTGHFPKAAQTYDRVTKLDPSDASAWSSAGLLYGSMGDYPDTVRCLAQAVKLGPTDPFRVRFIYGCALASLGRHDLAAQQFQYASILQPTEFAAWYDLGLEDQALGRYSDAISAYRQACQLDPTSTPAVVNLANAMIHSGQTNDAVDVLSGAIAVEPQKAALHAALATVYVALNNTPSAMTELRTAIKLNPTDNLARAGLANLEMQTKDYAGALDQYAALVKAAPQSDSLRTELGEALIEVGRYKDAAVSLQDAVALNPKNARAWNNLGAANEHLGRTKIALGDYRRAVAADPTLAQARQNLRRLTSPQAMVPEQIIVKPQMTLAPPAKAAPTPAASAPPQSGAASPTPTPVQAPSAGTIHP